MGGRVSQGGIASLSPSCAQTGGKRAEMVGTCRV